MYSLISLFVTSITYDRNEFYLKTFFFHFKIEINKTKTMASKTSNTSIRPTVVVASSSTSKGKIIPISSFE